MYRAGCWVIVPPPYRWTLEGLFIVIAATGKTEAHARTVVHRSCMVVWMVCVFCVCVRVINALVRRAGVVRFFACVYVTFYANSMLSLHTRRRTMRPVSTAEANNGPQTDTAALQLRPKGSRHSPMMPHGSNGR